MNKISGGKLVWPAVPCSLFMGCG